MRNARALQRIAIILAVLFVLSLLPVTQDRGCRRLSQLLPPTSGAPTRAGRGRSAR